MISCSGGDHDLFSSSSLVSLAFNLLRYMLRFHSISCFRLFSSSSVLYYLLGGEGAPWPFSLRFLRSPSPPGVVPFFIIVGASCPNLDGCSSGMFASWAVLLRGVGPWELGCEPTAPCTSGRLLIRKQLFLSFSLIMQRIYRCAENSYS